MELKLSWNPLVNHHYILQSNLYHIKMNLQISKLCLKHKPKVLVSQINDTTACQTTSTNSVAGFVIKFMYLLKPWLKSTRLISHDYWEEELASTIDFKEFIC